MARHDSTQCEAFRQAVVLLGRPWTASLLNALQPGPLRFSEVAQRVDGIGSKMLSARLKELEARGLLVRSVEPGPPVRVGYGLTDKGQAFGEVAKAIERWGHKLVEGA